MKRFTQDRKRGQRYYNRDSVEMAVESCWDCPIPVREVLVQYAVFTALIVLAATMMAARRQLFRGLGWMATVALFFWVAIYTVVIPRWGIGVSEVPLETWARRRSWLVLIAMDVALGVIARVTFRWRSARQVATALDADGSG